MVDGLYVLGGEEGASLGVLELRKQRSHVVCQLLGYEPGVYRLKHDVRELDG